MILNKEDLEFIAYAWSLLNSARYCDGKRLTEVYNRCFADRPNFRPKTTTNCGSCMRQMVVELKRESDRELALQQQKRITQHQQPDLNETDAKTEDVVPVQDDASTNVNTNASTTEDTQAQQPPKKNGAKKKK